MVDTLKATPGAVGLAAPQVGVSVRAFVMGTEEQGYIAVVNPRIVKRSGIKISNIEECLSVPGQRVSVRRSASVTVQATNAEGTPCEFTCKGQAASIVQHEIDGAAVGPGPLALLSLYWALSRFEPYFVLE
jgi:peptide deformylase